MRRLAGGFGLPVVLLLLRNRLRTRVTVLLRLIVDAAVVEGVTGCLRKKSVRMSLLLVMG